MTFASSKRVLAVLLLLCMVFGLLPAVAFADGDVAEEPVIEEAAEAVAEEAADAEEIEIPDPDFEALTVEPEAASVNAAATKYTLTFEPNFSGSSRARTASVAAGAVVDLSAYKVSHPYKSYYSNGGYTERYPFLGWLAPDGTLYGEADSYTMPAENTTLTAQWGDAVESYHWELSIEGSGTVAYSKNGPEYTLHEDDEAVKLYVNESGQAHLSIFSTFTPDAAEGYVFQGWYISTADGEEKLDDYNLKMTVVRDHKLTAAMCESGHNKIVGRFMVNDGTLATVKYEWPYNVKGFVVPIGSATPTIEDPTNSNLFFLGWEPAVAATVTGNVTYTAKWLDGPTTENTVDPLYTIRCISGEGVNGSHADMTGNVFFCTSNNDIAYDESKGTYTCTVTGDRIGTLIGVGGSSYDGTVHQEHHLVDSDPIIHLVWDSSEEKWKPDGEQIVEVYHDFGDKEISFDELSKISRVICVVDSDDTDTYKPVKMLKNTYEITYAQATGNNTRSAEVRITDFDAYASALNLLYQPDWENNFHPKDYYAFYMERTLETRSFADGTTYYAWSDWKLDTVKTEYQSIKPVIHNEALYGKELMVRIPKFTVTFTDGDANGAAFAPVVFDVFPFDGVGDLPYWDADDPFEWTVNNVLRFNPAEYQLPTGEFFIDWAPELPAPNAGVTEDLLFEAQWDKKVYVAYYDGCSDPELPWGEGIMEYEYYPNYNEFPVLLDDEGNAFEPERENCTFNSWKSVEDPEATEYIVDEATGYTVNVYREEADGVVYTDFAILLVADWTWDVEPVIAQVASLTLDGTIGLNFLVTLPPEISETAEAVFLYKGNEYPVSVLSVEPDSRGYSMFTFSIPAAEFANTVALQFVDDGIVIPFEAAAGPLKNNTLKYSGQKYSKALPDCEARPLVDMLHNYCYHAYFGLEKAAPDVAPKAIATNPDISTVTADALAEYKNKLDGSVTGLSITAISLNLESTTEINIKFELDPDHSIDEYSFTLDGTDVTPVSAGSNAYMVTVYNIAANKLDNMHTFSVTAGDEALTAQCCALGYCYNVLKNNYLSAEMQNTCKALYLYNVEANAYFGD